MTAVSRAPYRATLREFYHLQQLDRIDDLRQRGNALHLAGLVAIAFHEPKKLADEHHRLLVDAGLAVVVDHNTALENARALVEAIEKVDAAQAWVAMESPQ